MSSPAQFGPAQPNAHALAWLNSIPTTAPALTQAERDRITAIRDGCGLIPGADRIVARCNLLLAT